MLDSAHGQCAEDSARYSIRCVARRRTNAGVGIPMSHAYADAISISSKMFF